MSANLQKPKPGLAAALLLPFGIWIVASIVAVVFLVMGIQQAEDVYDEFARVPDGQATSVELTATGGYRIWLENSRNNTTFATASATVTGPDGESIPVEGYTGSLDYNDATAVLTFNVDETGTYTIEANDTGFDSAGSQFLVGKGNPFSEAGKGVVLMVLIGSVGFVIALIIMIIMLVRRGRSKKRIIQASLQGGGGYGGGGYGAGGYQQPGGYPPPGGYQQPSGYPQPGGFPPPGGTPPPPGSTW